MQVQGKFKAKSSKTTGSVFENPRPQGGTVRGAVSMLCLPDLEAWRARLCAAARGAIAKGAIARGAILALCLLALTGCGRWWAVPLSFDCQPSGPDRELMARYLYECDKQGHPACNNYQRRHNEELRDAIAGWEEDVRTLLVVRRELTTVSPPYRCAQAKAILREWDESQRDQYPPPASPPPSPPSPLPSPTPPPADPPPTGDAS